VLENCSFPYQGIKYYNSPQLSSADTPSVNFAALAWSDVPTMLTITQMFSQSLAEITITSISDPSKTWDGLTTPVCVSGITITLNDYILNQEINVNQLATGYQDLAMSVAAHEMGHAFGLDHSQVPQSLMWHSSSRYFSYRIFVPVVDDVRALASLYGWAKDTGFPNEVYPTSSPPCSSLPCYPQYYLIIPNSGSGTWSQTYASSPLPNTYIAIMFAYVTPLTLYRFHMGWEKTSNDPTNMLNRFATLELDNDGAEFVSVTNGGAITNIFTFSGGNIISAFNSYFLELLVECCNELKATAFAFQGSMSTGNGGETFIGSFDSGSGVIDGWTNANLFDTSVWTDSSSSPASSYSVDHFWNFQSGPKQPLPGSPTPPCCTTGGGGACSLAQGTLITITDGKKVPVQNLKIGDQMLGYDPGTGVYSISIVKATKTVITNNILIINTERGMPLRTDSSPTEILWAKLKNGTSLWLPVTQLTPDDSLFTNGGWIKVTSLQPITTGRHVMYDITATIPYFANGYLDPPKPS